MRIRFTPEVPESVRTLIRLIVDDFYARSVTYDIPNALCVARTLEVSARACVEIFNGAKLVVVQGYLVAARERVGYSHPRMDTKSDSYDALPFISQVVLELIWYVDRHFPQMIEDSRRRVLMVELLTHTQVLALKSHISWEEVVAAMTDIAPTVLGSSGKRRLVRSVDLGQR